MKEIEQADIRELIGQNKEILAKMDEMIVILNKIKSKRNKATDKPEVNNNPKLKLTPDILYSVFHYNKKRICYLCSEESKLFEEKDLKFISRLRPLKIIRPAAVNDGSSDYYIGPVLLSSIVFFRGESTDIVYQVLLAQFNSKPVIDLATSKTISVLKIREFKKILMEAESYKKYLDLTRESHDLDEYFNFIHFVENPNDSGY